MATVLFLDPPDPSVCNPKTVGSFVVGEGGYCFIEISDPNAGPFIVETLVGPNTWVPYLVNGATVQVGVGFDTKVNILQPGKYRVNIPAGTTDLMVKSDCFDECPCSVSTAAGAGGGGVDGGGGGGPITIANIPLPVTENPDENKFTGVGLTVVCDTADNQPVVVQTRITETGVVDTSYFKNGAQMANPPAIGPCPQDTIDIERVAMFDTDTTTGEIRPFTKFLTFRNGIYDPTADALFNTTVTPSVAYTPAGTVGNEPELVRIGNAETLAVSAAAPLPNIPQFAAYAEVYIDAGPNDSNIRWTIDGTAPTDNNGEQENMGSTIHLRSRAAIDGFRAAAIDEQGNLAPGNTANLTINYWNRIP